MSRTTSLVAKTIGVALMLAVLVLIAAHWRHPETVTTVASEWTCSMHPFVRQGAPGQCPVCGMDLVPVQEVGKEQANIETEAIAHRELVKEIRTVGKIDYNEARVAYIAARIAGRIDRLYADFTGIEVKQEDHLAQIYSPDLVVAQEELIVAVESYERNRRPEQERLLEATRSKLRLWGMLPRQVRDIESSRRVQTHLTLYAPIGGTIIEKSVREGQYVKEGDMLYRIANLDPLWLYLEIYEYDIASVRFGQPVEVSVQAYPGQTFSGMVVFIDPFLDDKTRTVRVRVNLPNADKKLKPNMYATATIKARLLADGGPAPTGLEGKYVCPMHPDVIRDEKGKCPQCGMELIYLPERSPFVKEMHHVTKDSKPLAIRASAVLDTGRRQITYRQRSDGAYELVELKLGAAATSKDATGQPTRFYPVLGGLELGDKVVTRGGFLVDSQTQIEGKPSLLYPEGRTGASLHGGHGAPAPSPSKTGAHSGH